VWYVKTRNDDDDYIDEYVEKLSKIATVKFTEDSSIKNITVKKNNEESATVKDKEVEEKKTEDAR